MEIANGCQTKCANGTCDGVKSAATKQENKADDNGLYDDVRQYYGTRIKTTDDLQTSVCTVGRRGMPTYLKQAMALIHDDVQAKYYGCGLIAPTALEGRSVLDLGSGAGMDCFVLSKLVGPAGHVTGLDMTDEQLDVARAYTDHHTRAFGYDKPNVDFVKGYIEQLTEAGLKESQFDIIISNCVVNLSPDKKKVLAEAYRVLKPGGEMYFSDVYSDKDLPQSIRQHKDLWGECIAGALSWEELHSFSQEVGFCRPRLVTASTFVFKKDELTDIVAGYKFVSATYRLVKLPVGAEKSVSTVTYNGQIPHEEAEMVFDNRYTFKPAEPQAVDAELAAILQHSRYGEFFTVEVGTGKAPCCIKKNPFVFAEEKGSSSGGCC